MNQMSEKRFQVLIASGIYFAVALLVAVAWTLRGADLLAANQAPAPAYYHEVVQDEPGTVVIQGEVSEDHGAVDQRNAVGIDTSALLRPAVEAVIRSKRSIIF